MGGKGRLIKAGVKGLSKKYKEYTNAMTKNSTNNMSKNGTIDKMIDKNPVIRTDYSKLAKSIRPNTNNEAAAMAVGAAGTYGVMKANEKKKVKVEKKPRKVFMNTKMRD